jgi:hypothetical protein
MPKVHTSRPAKELVSYHTDAICTCHLVVTFRPIRFHHCRSLNVQPTAGSAPIPTNYTDCGSCLEVVSCHGPAVNKESWSKYVPEINPLDRLNYLLTLPLLRTSIPITVCVPGCTNGGQCTAPDTCTCPPEWGGYWCDVPGGFAGLKHLT